MFVCKKMSPPNGEANLEQKRGAAGKRTANLAEKMCLEDDPFYGIFGIFSGAIFG